ncbi:MAG: ribonuclease P protein component [Chloroflexi bacterium]|nr:MAG: ribonuclease P protein component [Chloroflexota bacterium]
MEELATDCVYAACRRVKRNFRLTSTTDYKRVRRFGRSFAHPLLVLVVLKNDLDKSRFAVTASRAVGKAVQRNRVKRLLREAVRSLVSSITPGWDVILIARRPVVDTDLLAIQSALVQLLQRSKLLLEDVSKNGST